VSILTAVAPPGLEPVVARELADRGLTPHLQPGHVQVRVDGPVAAARVAPFLRTPARLLLELAHGDVSNLDQLARLVRSIDWSPFLRRRTPIGVSVVSRGSRIRRKDVAARKIEHAIADIQRQIRTSGGARNRPVQQHIRARIDGRACTISIDVGGDLLHKRGWRQVAGKAPLRETLGASLLTLAGWTGDEPLLDPFCGAGTFVVEAGLMAMGRTPFVGTALACADWPVVGPQSAPRPLPLEVPLFAFDHDPRAVEMTEQNARRAQIPVQVEQHDIGNPVAPAPSGLLIANPPWGARLGQSETSVQGVYRALGHALRGPLAGWRALFVAPSEALALAVDRRAFLLTTFSNGSRSLGAWGLDPARPPEAEASESDTL